MPANTNRWNILFLLTDQQRRDTLGCYGNQLVRTPNIDGLAATGVRFENAFTPSAVCTPTRASILTGLMPHKHGLLANFERNVGYPTDLPPELPSFAHWLRAKGYRVGHVGKWHAGLKRGPMEHGFDGPHYPGWSPPVQHPDYLAYLRRRGLPGFAVNDEVRGVFPNGTPGNVIMGRYEGPVESLFDWFVTERAIERLRDDAREYRENGTPFYLACHWFGPHLPYYLPPEYYDLYDPSQIPLPTSMQEAFEGKPLVQRHYSRHWTYDSFSPETWRKIIAVYWGYVALLDAQVGRILAELDRLGLRSSTLVVYGTDHGAFVGAHRLQDKGPAMYDDIYRIPLLVRLPGGAAGTVHDEFVSLVDLTATFVEVAGGNVPGEWDGFSLLPLLATSKDERQRTDRKHTWPRQDIVAEFHGHHFPYPQRMIRTDRYKLVVNPPDVNELYDLEKDPLELRNRIDDPKYREVARELYARLYQRLQLSGDNFYHWMSSMFDVGARVDDASLSAYKLKK